MALLWNGVNGSGGNTSSSDDACGWYKGGAAPGVAGGLVLLVTGTAKRPLNSYGGESDTPAGTWPAAYGAKTGGVVVVVGSPLVMGMMPASRYAAISRCVASNSGCVWSL